MNLSRSTPVRRQPGVGSPGFTLVETLVAGLVLVVGLIAIAQFFSSAVARVADSDDRTMMHQLATEMIERLRALPYDKVGTVGGHPGGTLPESETVNVSGVNLLVERFIIYAQDPANPTPAYSGAYKRVTIKVSVPDNPRIEPMELVTNIAGGMEGGVLDVTVIDLSGAPVADSRLKITNTHLSPQVLIDNLAIRTRANGNLNLPGLKQDNGKYYFITATKTGYNPVANKTGSIVLKGQQTEVVFIQDRLATLTIRLVNAASPAQPLANVSIRVRGPLSISPWEFNQTYVTDAAGSVTIPNIQYSTASDPYTIELTTPSTPPIYQLLDDGESQPGIDGKISVILDPGTTRTITVVKPS